MCFNGHVIFIFPYCVLSIHCFHGNLFPDLTAIDTVNVHHTTIHHEGKRSADVYDAPYRINTRISGQLYDVTLKFQRKKDIRSSPVISTGEGDRVVKHDIGNIDCLVFYEDANNLAHAVLDTCRPETNQFQMIAEVYINGSQHVILPSNDSGDQGQVEHELYSVSAPVDFLNDYSVTEKHNKESSPPTPRDGTRQKRQVSGTQVVEIAFVIDYNLYQFWYGMTNVTSAQRSTDALVLIRNFYSFIANGMDLRYQGLAAHNLDIRVELVYIHVLQTAAESSFTETNAGNTIDAGYLLVAFKAWITAYSNFPKSDHVMLLTGRDMSISGNSNAAGLANLGEICSIGGLSVVEGSFNFLMVVIASHELAHSLGGNHDGDNNSCNSTDGYILSVSNSVLTGSKARNPWIFSNCSADSIIAKITQLNTIGNNCLQTIDNSARINATGPMAGQVYPPDDQCKNIYGTGSALTRVLHVGKWEQICTGMWCGKGGTNATNFVIPADGTACGNEKLCLNGECVAHVSAQVADANCLFGDQPGPSCATQISSYLGSCYNENVRSPCCTSCAAAKLDIVGCEYGDVYDCSNIYPTQCYNTTLSGSACCKTCTTFAKNNLPEACKYGDRNSNCATNLCQQNPNICCETCVGYTPPTSVTSTIDPNAQTTKSSQQTTKSPDDTSSLPSWVIPVAAGVGGAFLIGVLVAICCCCCRNKESREKNHRQRRHNRPRDEERYDKPRRTSNTSHNSNKQYGAPANPSAPYNGYKPSAHDKYGLYSNGHNAYPNNRY